ncbi:MAG: hypothetical protein M3O50_21315 [Myxococcota bacterium]|nr:hypothetical protein [Myxococcota bacterium]
MQKNYWPLAFGGTLIVAACAKGSSSGDLRLTGGDQPGGSFPAGGATSDPSASPLADDGGPTGPSFVDDSSAVQGNGDGGVNLGAPGSMGLCVSGRSCDLSCDQLVENGKHEYIERAPEDGSALPPANVASLFGTTAATSGGPCIVEPPNGALFPNNWVRPRIRFSVANPNQSLFQIRIHAARQSNDLVVYTASKSWKIPKNIWTALAASTWGEDITVTVTAVDRNGGAPSSSQVTFQIAPAYANGSLIYWAAVGKNAGQAWLEGFSVGDENVAVALTLPQLQWKQARAERGDLQTRGTSPGTPGCLGCHVAVPDRKSVTFNEDWPWDGVSAMVDPGNAGKLPPWLTPGGAEALSMPWLGMMSFSPHVWNDQMQHIVVAAFQGESTFPPSASGMDGGPAPGQLAVWGYQGGNEWDPSPKSQLAWIDLSTTVPPVAPAVGPANGDQLSLGMAANQGKSWGIIPRTGDPSGVNSPAWAHAGDTIVYTSTNASMSGRMGTGVSDLWSVPYNNMAGGAATPVRGASDPNWNEYYPSYSADDKFIAFNRTPLGDNMYYAARGEVFVLPATGGTPTRLAANDPPSCMNVRSPGVTNSWVKWSPEYPNCGKRYYWLVFSSSREGIRFASQNEVTSQLYLTAITVDESNTVKSYPGIFIWNQHTTATVPPYGGQTQSNHTPQWEPIDLPVPPPPPPPPRPPM